MSVPPTKRVRGDHARSCVDAATHDKSGDTSEEKSAGALPNDRVVVLNVGGTLITTLYSTLCSSPSQLADWAEHDFNHLPRDRHGHPFLDRDPTIFAHLINYLRGYGLPSKADDLVVVAEDADLLRLDALKREIGLNPPSMWRFTPGPGVREDGVEFSTSDILDLCGTEPLSTGLVHTIVFRMDKCELVSVGVIAFRDVQLDTQIRRQKNSVCYCNTGELVRFWYEDPLFDQCTLYKSQDEITVRVEFAQPGVPLEGEREHRALPPPLQPALRQAEPLFSAVATANAPGTGGATSAYPPAIASSRTTVTINTGGASEANTTASALQPGSPVMDATANRAPQAGRGPALGNVGAPAPATTASSANVNATATTATTTPAVAAPSASPSTAPTATTAAGQGGAAPTSPGPTAAPLTLDPEDPDAPIGAIVSFFKGEREVCRTRWPAPVPPLQFAVSMQGASAVSILRASSVSADVAVTEADK